MTITSLATHRQKIRSGLELAYYDSLGASQQTGPKVQKDAEEAIVLLHGYCGSSAYWHALQPLLQRAGRVIIPDLRGHGASEAPVDEVYAMESFASDLDQLLEGIGVKRAWLFGHSLGGYVTLAYAEQYAERLSGLGLIHSTAWPDSVVAQQNRDKAVQEIRSEGIAPFVTGLVPKLFAPVNKERLKEEVERAITIGKGTSPHGAAATALGMKDRKDRRVILEQWNKPLLLVAGEQDGIIAADKTFSVDGAHVKQELLKHCGHMSMVEAPTVLSNVLKDFIDA